MNEELVDSAIDREIKATNEREYQLKKERDMLINSQDFQEMTEVDRDTHAQSDVIEEDDLADDLERSLDINEKSVVREESLIEREIRLAKEREEELRQQRTSLAQNKCSPPSTPVTPIKAKPTPKFSNSTPPTLPSTPSSVHTNSPTTSGRYENSTRMIESRLARELREQREKEDELRSLRKQMGLFTEVDGVETTPILPNVPKVETPPPTPEVAISPAPFVETTPPPDSPPPSRIKVAPLLEEDKTDLSQFATVSSETPIEREIRLAREREESFRREKGIKLKAYQEEQIMSVPQQKPIEESPNNLNKANQSQSYKKWAHTRIQNEIKLEQAREENLRHQGRIISTSKDYEPDRKKYQEVAPVEGSPSFRRVNGSPTKIHNDIQPKIKTEEINRKLSDVSQPDSPDVSVKSEPEPVVVVPKPPPPKDNVPKPISTSSSMNFQHSSVQPTSVKRSTSESLIRSSPSGQDRIEREVREMKAREIELRRQRHSLGIYQNELIADDELDSEIFSPTISSQSTDVNSAERSRRRSKLEADWQQKIQQSLHN
ncbi:DgyrCDS3120 [Dimorphilus gyrociliatus]|uniref:DgyrCDS3120 n=1 Tax=Dimorphilus gyrociliatus TaxID=2664684 RepID=A0A7I8VC81_9ANNE|nr:DgyrCDS3120 [Dimorphilus gyrociliatus]